MINERRMYCPEEVAEIARAYKRIVISLALGPSMRQNPLEQELADYESNVPNNVHELLDVESMFETLNCRNYKDE